jgi:membrane protein involved in colicin uptake
MARRSLRPHLNQIRGWVRQGRTDAWIAHQLEVTVQQIQAFKRENELAPDADGGTGADFDDEIDLRAEDDALIAAELEAAAEAKAREEAEAKAREEAQARAREEADAQAREEAQASSTAEAEAASGDGGAPAEPADAEEEAPKRRARPRRGGRSRRKATPITIEGTFDHGEEGYGLWLDPAVQDDPIYAEHWAGHRPIEVTITEDEIVIRRTPAGDGEDDD